MRLRMNNRRERRFNTLVEAADENTKSKALDAAAEYYIKMRGNTTVKPTGAIEELMGRAVEAGSVTPGEIADILDTEELPVKAQTDWSVGFE